MVLSWEILIYDSEGTGALDATASGLMFDRNRMSCVADCNCCMKRLLSLRVSDLASGIQKARGTAGLLAAYTHLMTSLLEDMTATRRHVEHAYSPETVSLCCPTRSPEPFEPTRVNQSSTVALLIAITLWRH
jgi:hypothetical protein